MQIHRAFWIKLGRLGAMLDQIDDARARLARIERGASFANLQEDEQEALLDTLKLLDDIAHLD